MASPDSSAPTPAPTPTPVPTPPTPTPVPAPVLVDVDGPIAVLTLNRPAVRNAIDDATRAALGDALAELGQAAEVRVVILTGAGSAFCAGGDIKAMEQRLAVPPGEVAIRGWQRQHGTYALTAGLHRLDQVTIAAVNGPAAGLGMDLALACDFIVADPDASFVASFVLRGLVPDGGSMYHLPRRVGPQRAKELLLSGRRVDATEALEIGLIDLLAEPGAVLAHATEYAARFTERSRAALMLAKSIINRSFESSLDQIASLGSQAQAICYTTDAHRDSVRSFLDRRGLDREGRAAAGGAPEGSTRPPPVPTTE
ncbi:enoyl-CoA hydratase/isomerase family protein [Plantactinospora soyae]|uniref:Enoyl-CoA hydratase/carnithine racemase n=1 Tax=Plantactinospora soyae TaxID=1544732 RepID=A0A927M2P3_9ACTN|nr:enoyl-CoA hydratase/isomerase family protein [Plantactinospora soyae]MBE1484463.1 enoyl-CoA hydratase/carnithine racemase [Plantactinospora soyae]